MFRMMKCQGEIGSSPLSRSVLSPAFNYRKLDIGQRFSAPGGDGRRDNTGDSTRCAQKDAAAWFGRINAEIATDVINLSQ